MTSYMEHGAWPPYPCYPKTLEAYPKEAISAVVPMTGEQYTVDGLSSRKAKSVYPRRPASSSTSGEKLPAPMIKSEVMNKFL